MFLNSLDQHSTLLGLCAGLWWHSVDSLKSSCNMKKRFWCTPLTGPKLFDEKSEGVVFCCINNKLCQISHIQCYFETIMQMRPREPLICSTYFLVPLIFSTVCIVLRPCRNIISLKLCLAMWRYCKRQVLVKWISYNWGMGTSKENRLFSKVFTNLYFCHAQF